MGALERAIERVPPSQSVFLLSEIKVRSPRDGDLIGDRAPATLAREMVDAGADGLSVVVEPEHFGGSLDVLETVAEAVPDSVPILAKDFFDSTDAIDRAADHGADAVLLICQDLSNRRLQRLFEHCLDSGIDPLVETHVSAEIETANELRAPIVGINNRNIGELELDDGGVERTESLAPLVHEDAAVVSESSLTSGSAVRRAVDAGADAVLIGTKIMQARDVSETIEELKSVGV